MLDPRDALERLRDGNRRFASDSPPYARHVDRARRAELAAAQHPFAIVLGCSDSRVPAEIVFDQGLGDLFVVRVAGNVVAPSQMGSVEFAAERFGTRLVVVLGHSRCGAVMAALDELRNPDPGDPGPIVARVRPAVERVLTDAPDLDDEDMIERAVRENIRASVESLRHESELLSAYVKQGRLQIVGAEYALETGLVHLLDEVPSE